MISVAPIDANSSTELTLSRIEKVVVRAITDTVDEWKRQLLRGSRSPFGSTSIVAKKLVTAFDFLLSYGFTRGNRMYWLFVKEFMLRSEADYLKREWRVTSTRQLSFAWLKDVLNKQTLISYFQSFQQDLETIRKYYNSEALMANQLLLSRIVEKIMEINDVQFRFLKPLEKRNEVPVAIMRSTLIDQRPSVSNYESIVPLKFLQEEQECEARRQKLQKSVPSEDASSLLIDVCIPANFVETHPASPDVLVNSENGLDKNFELLSSKRRVSSDGTYSSQLKETDEECTRILNEGEVSIDREQHKSDIAVTVDPFDIALKTSLSKAKHSVEDEPQKYKDHKLSPLPTLTDLPFGEVRLDMGEVIGLSISVFKLDTERFMRLFQVYTHFGTGKVERRLLALSNKAAYLLSVESIVALRKSYIIRAYLPLQYVSCINVGPDFQVIYLHAEKDYNVCEGKADKFLSVIEICAACKELGVAVLDAIKYAYENYVSDSHSKEMKLHICTDSTPHHLILQHFMSKELNEETPALLGYYLAQWRQTNLQSISGEGYQHSGYLYHKEVHSGVSWLFGSSEFQQSYFHLQNKKLYQFSDSTCKFGERVISVRDTIIDVVELKSDERAPHMFEIVFDNSSKIQFICQSAADMHKWVSLISRAIICTDMNDEPVACVVCLCKRSILVAQEGLNCEVDGFMRLLMRIDLVRISQATGIFVAERSACVIRNDDKLNWLFMRSPDETDRLLGQLSELGVTNVNIEEGSSSRLSAILNSLPRFNDISQFTDALPDNAYETSLRI